MEELRPRLEDVKKELPIDVKTKLNELCDSLLKIITDINAAPNDSDWVDEVMRCIDVLNEFCIQHDCLDQADSTFYYKYIDPTRKMSSDVFRFEYLYYAALRLNFILLMTKYNNFDQLVEKHNLLGSSATKPLVDHLFEKQVTKAGPRSGQHILSILKRQPDISNLEFHRVIDLFPDRIEPELVRKLLTSSLPMNCPVQYASRIRRLNVKALLLHFGPKFCQEYKEILNELDTNHELEKLTTELQTTMQSIINNGLMPPTAWDKQHLSILQNIDPDFVGLRPSLWRESKWNKSSSSTTEEQIQERKSSPRYSECSKPGLIHSIGTSPLAESPLKENQQHGMSSPGLRP